MSTCRMRRGRSTPASIAHGGRASDVHWADTVSPSAIRGLSFACLLAAACAHPPPAAPVCPKPPPVVDRREELLAADRAFSNDTDSLGLAGWLRWFHPDGAMLPEAGPVARGQDAIRARMAPFFLAGWHLT